MVLEVGGLGFKVNSPRIIISRTKVGASLKFFCFFYQETFEIYGFEKEGDLNFFELLNSISGIGPKMALKIMNNLETEKIKNLIVSGNQEILSKRLGVSGKTASKIILELKEKIKKEELALSPEISDYNDVYDVLKSLGYKKNDIEAALEKIPAKIKTLEEKVKSALRTISSKNQRK